MTVFFLVSCFRYVPLKSSEIVTFWFLERKSTFSFQFRSDIVPILFRFNSTGKK